MPELKSKLNLGAGKDIKEGYLNLDIVPLKGIDVVHDLNKIPYPFRDNQFEEILCLNVLEHLDDFQKVLEELHRIGSNGARVKIGVPYWNSLLVWADPQHKRGFTLDTFTFFEKSHYYNFRFKVIKQELIGSKVGKLFPGPLRYLLSYFLCNIVEGMRVELEVVK
ncbi:MAG: methyltransferase domain-containing protein [Candidatus Woesearchaeota archaeon]